MKIDDLDKFIVIAATENLQKAAEILDCNASMLSKALKRLEYYFNAPLFDRVGKHIRLNSAGQTLQNKAAQFAADLKQTKVDIAKQQVNITYLVVGPGVILRRWGCDIDSALRKNHDNISIQFKQVYESQSLEQVINGLADLAFITGAIINQVPIHLHCQPMGQVTLQLAASHCHPLFAKQSLKSTQNTPIDPSSHLPTASFLMKDILTHAFVVPEQSPFCGKTDTLSCDGWNEASYPRTQQIVCNDDGLTSRLIHAGQALAYLPYDWINLQGLIPITARDANTSHREDIFIVSRSTSIIKQCMQSNQI